MGSTKELLNRIKCIGRKEFIGEVENSASEVSDMMKEILQEKQIPLKQAIQDLLLDRSYGYQIFRGSRKPTRLTLLRFALLYQLDLETTQRLLRVGQKPELYVKRRFDAAVVWGMEHQLTPEQTEELLQEIGESSLFER